MFPSVNFDGTGLAVEGEELVWMSGRELGLWVHDKPEDQVDQCGGGGPYGSDGG